MQRLQPGSIFAWCFYDWANSAFPTLITTFVFATYFTQVISQDATQGTSQWGFTQSLVALIAALLAPLIGLATDRGQAPWKALLGFSLLCAIPSFGLWFFAPHSPYGFYALLLCGVAGIGFELSSVSYNALLPGLAPASWLGRISGWGWGLGYFGGLAALVIMLVCFIQPEQPLLGLDRDGAEHIRIAGPLSGLWFILFAGPLCWVVWRRQPYNQPQPPSPQTGLWQQWLAFCRQLARQLAGLRQQPIIGWFLLARLFYSDGLTTLFAFGGIFAAGSFGLSTEQILLFAIVLNITAGLGALLFGWIDDWIGPRNIILISLIALLILGSLLITTYNITLFWFCGAALGVFIGPLQSASRSLMAHLAPSGQEHLLFGLFAFSGRATSFLGPLLLAIITNISASQRAGMASILAFLAIGLLLFWGKVPAAHRPRLA